PVVTARAVASLDKLVRWSFPLLEPGGRLLALKGEAAAAELEDAAALLARAGVESAEMRVLGEGRVSEPGRTATDTRPANPRAAGAGRGGECRDAGPRRGTRERTGPCRRDRPPRRPSARMGQGHRATGGGQSSADAWRQGEGRPRAFPASFLTGRHGRGAAWEP